MPFRARTTWSGALAQRLRNQNPLNVHRLFEQIRKGGVFGGAQSGVFIAVLSALETALWDLAGKALNLPVYQLLGGKFRDRIRVYLDTALYQAKLPTPEQFAQAASKAAKDGYTAVKFDLDQGNDPNKYDAVQLDGQPGGDTAHGGSDDGGPAGRRTKHRHLRRHARPLRLSDRAAGGQADGAVEPDVAGRAGTGGERRRLQADRPGDEHTDLCRREHLPRSRVPASARDGRRGHHHARPAEGRRPRRRAADCQPRESVLRAVRATHGGLVPRRHGRPATCAPRFRTS